MQKLHETFGSSLEVPEGTHYQMLGEQVGNQLAVYLKEEGFKGELIEGFNQHVIKQLIVDFDPAEEICRFRPADMVVNDEPTILPVVEIGGKVVEKKAKLFRGIPELKQEDMSSIAAIWIMAHELGHGLQAAYALIHGYHKEGGFMDGIYTIPTPAEVWLENHPEDVLVPNLNDAQVVELERQAEGISFLFMRAWLRENGYTEATIAEMIDRVMKAHIAVNLKISDLLDQTDETTQMHEVYDGRFEKGQDIDLHERGHFVIQAVGYANPLTRGQLQTRFAT